jgi:phosphoglycolate phosphatase
MYSNGTFVRPLQAVLFDFDYTLADSSAAVVECANTALRAMGLPEVPEEEICRTIGLGIPETLVRLAGETQRHRAAEFRRYWRRRSDQIMVDWTRVFPYVPASLRRLRESGLATGIVSTKFRQRIEDVLHRDGLAGYFDLVIGGDDVSEFKPHPQGLLDALTKLGCAAESALYVGDSVTDAETARRAGVDFVAVLSGKTRRQEFLEYAPLGVFETVAEFSVWVETKNAELRGQEKSGSGKSTPPNNR